MERVDITDYNDLENIYLTRWKILQTPLFGIYLHAIKRPDNDRVLHDHPWNFGALILRGGYIERYAGNSREAISLARYRGEKFLPGTKRKWKIGSFHTISQGKFHCIDELLRVPTWSLVVVGRKNDSSWGFATEDGFVHHDDYETDMVVYK